MIMAGWRVLATEQAVALEHPDADARRQLFALYRGDLSVDESNLDAVIDRTDQVTASFLKELLRRAALIAADSSSAGPLRVTAAQLDTALDELLDTRNAMTRVLLGGRQRSADPPAEFDAGPSDDWDAP